MQGISSEKWEMSIRGKIFIVSGTEMESIINSREARFIRFRDLIVNPAYVEYFKKIESEHSGQIEAPDEKDLSSTEWLEKIKNV